MARPKLNKKKIGEFEYIRKAIRYEDADGNKKTKEIYGKTTAEFRAKHEAFLTALEKSKIDKAEEKSDEEILKLTVKWNMEQWLKNFKKDTVEGNTFQEYESKAKTWIYPNIGKKNIIKIDTLDCQDILNKMTQAGRAQSTKKQVYLLLSEFFTHALNFKIVTENPTLTLKKPIVEPPVPEPFTPKEMELILLHAGKSCDFLNYLFFLVAVNSGMRASEIAAISVEHIDFTNNVILVWRKLVDEKVDGKRAWVAKDYLKTNKSKRPVGMGPHLAEMLKNRIDNGKLKKHKDGFTYLFADAEGKPYHPDSYSQSFRYIVDKLIKEGLIKTDRGLHNCRHYHATQLVDAGKSLEFVARRLGDLPDTVNRYYIEGVQKSRKDDGLGEFFEML